MKKTLNTVSTFPNQRSWRWKGHNSIVAFVLLFAIFILRTVSLLQWLKLLVRNLRKSWFKTHSTDIDSKRVNVPPVVVELYLIGVAVLMFLLPKGCCFTYWAAVYFMIETTVWVLYYHIFRRFYEERYSIMHKLEYFILIPLVIIIQGLCISVIEGLPTVESISQILNPSPDAPVYVSALNIVYVALVLGIVITNLPSERVKEKHMRKDDISVLGTGSVVTGRLVPAIAQRSEELKVKYYDTSAGGKTTKTINAANGEKIKLLPVDEDCRKSILNSNILWISTPSYLHLEQAGRFLNNDMYIAIEKPLTSLKAELPVLKNLMRSENRGRIFCLSYYYLEKALPLTYLYNPLGFYEKYIIYDNGDSREKVLSLFAKLGKIKNVKLEILEGPDEREWVADPYSGGQYLETFIHIALLNKMIVGEDTPLEELRWEYGNYNDGQRTIPGTYISCTGYTGDCSFELTISKFSREKRRGGELIYENGSIKLDFETCSCQCQLNEGSSFTIMTDPSYRKYGIQLDMVLRCFEEDIRASNIDGSSIQVKTLEWLFDQNPASGKTFDYNM